jgi:MoxR-like ATPase
MRSQASHLAAARLRPRPRRGTAIITQTENTPVQSGAAGLLRLRDALNSIIRGKSEVVELALVSLLARGHLLIEDVPGVGKTTLGQALARLVHCTFHRIQFTSDLLPSDVLGISIYDQQRQSFEFRPGPIFTNVLLADEINRTTPKTQSALLESMNEGQVTLDNVTYALPQPFMVIATQNPVEHHGTYPLPESQLDRFLVRIRVGYPDGESERDIIRSYSAGMHFDGITPVMEAADVLAVQERVKQVTVDEELVNYTIAIVARTRQNEFLSLGVSPRGSMALYRAAQALAFLSGRDYATPDDFKRLAVPVFAHRVVLSTRYTSTLRTSDQAAEVLREIVDSVAVPL